jgi:hypothetical protein
MPEYDATHQGKPEDRYQGPPPAREYDAGAPAGQVETRRAQPVPAVKPPPDAPAPLESVSPPPGHTAQP